MLNNYISSSDWHFIFIMLISAALGMIVGLERAFKHKAASVRTFSLISSASCLFCYLSIAVAAEFQGDPTRIAAQVVSGISFLGAGVIFKSDNKIEGITTGAMSWFSAAMGMACGLGYVNLAIFTVILYFVILMVGKICHKLVDRIEGKGK